MIGQLLLPFLLAAALLQDGIDSVILRSGSTLPVAGEIRIEGSQMIFRHPNGLLYSLSITEVDLEAMTRAKQRSAVPEATSASRESGRLRKAVSDEELRRLIEKLNASPPSNLPRREVALDIPMPQAPLREELAVDERGEEQYWRDRSRRLEENVRRRKEDLALIIDRERNLEDQIRSFLSLGYDPNQFSYHVFQLQNARDSMEGARLEVTRATREWDQFRDDARREGILPGWLR